MKISIKIFIGITILLLLVTVFAIVNTKVSMKYEVDEPTAMNKVTELVTQKAKDIKSLLFFLWTFFIYEVTTLSLLIWVLTKLKNNP
jgi:hypothetical protein